MFSPFTDEEAEIPGKQEIFFFFKFVVELDDYTARSLFPHLRTESNLLSVPQSLGVFVTCMRGAESLCGFSLISAVLLLTSDPSWFLERYCLLLVLLTSQFSG